MFVDAAVSVAANADQDDVSVEVILLPVEPFGIKSNFETVEPFN